MRLGGNRGRVDGKQLEEPKTNSATIDLHDVSLQHNLNSL